MDGGRRTHPDIPVVEAAGGGGLTLTSLWWSRRSHPDIPVVEAAGLTLTSLWWRPAEEAEASSAESSLPRRPVEAALGPRRAREETADSAGRGDTSEDTDRHGQTGLSHTDGQTLTLTRIQTQTGKVRDVTVGPRAL